MNDTHQTSAPVLQHRAPLIILSALAGIIATFIFLESQGLLKHSAEKDQFALSQYKAVLIDQQQDSQYRLSHKASHQHARCIEGFLFIQADTNPAMKGLLVDYKNRGIKCASLAVPDSIDSKTEERSQTQ